MGIGEGEDFCKAIIRLGMESRADLFMCQMQDWLNLDGGSRMNEPGVLKTRNWRWRMLPGADSPQLAAEIAALTKNFGRA
jgi:4-alpha-glucanotransferase